MYEDTGDFQDNLKLSMEDFSYPQQHHNLDMDMDMEMRFDMDNYGNTHLIHDPSLLLSVDHPHLGFQLDPPYPPAPDLLNLLHLPRYPNSFAADNGLDPLFHLNLPPQPPLFTFPPQDADAQDYDTFLDYAKDIADDTGRKTRRGKIAKPTERDRRNHLSEKYSALRSLVPNPTKGDRASIVSDAIGYIKELLKSVGELKIVVEKKRRGRERVKKRKREEDGEVDSCNPDCQSLNASSSRKSNDTEVDVRLIDDEVTIKLVQRNNINSNCLLVFSKVLDELHLDLHHVAGGNIGDYHSFIFNTKIYEGSSVYASAIANKLMEALEAELAGGYSGRLN